ncbi:SDR family oxidoreductase [Rhizobium sp. ARZ01]|uniref:SDR family NAD(P)-dependent oxidoreductase n=1 Tax=Rhizobium sp. ARZ01 TaxID=2769313 RepID=UPI001783349C|nr:SDR family oxidoreductase [Rhizobium sp. ARZ01]MBD9373010.1 SDR family oxidoreductase [Rhizobium sp. ARZ01]
MLLENRIAIVHGAAGAIGAATAKAFAHEGAIVYLCGRTKSKLEDVAAEILAAGGRSEVAELNAFDEQAVERNAAWVADRHGGIDIVFNAVGIDPVQGTSLADIAYDDFARPIADWTKTQFLTARAAARHMVPNRRGCVLMLSASPARLAIAMTGGFGVACAAIEGLSRTLAAELSPHGVRVVCLRPHRILETIAEHPDLPMGMADFRAFLENMTLLKRLPTLEDVADTAVFLASDRASAITGTVANLTAGCSVD